MPVDWTQVLLSLITLAGMMFTTMFSAFIAWKMKQLKDAKELSDRNWKAAQADTHQKLSEVGHAVEEIKIATNGIKDELIENVRVLAKMEGHKEGRQEAIAEELSKSKEAMRKLEMPK